MSQRQLNLGILAHVDAGKTTLTERLLYETGAIAEPGSVDAGTTRTDTLALERQRGITIRSAVTSFALGGVHVNLIDTPGHPDFIAEVDRVLGMLDGAVLVISAVEGVQPQTRILLRALRRLGVPTLFFANKLDRVGASVERTLHAISERLTSAVVCLDEPLDTARVLEALADHDERLLETYVHGGRPADTELWSAVAEQTRRGLLHPLFSGSAITGAGVGRLLRGIEDLLPAGSGDPDGPLDASVFKIERDPTGEKVAYARLFSGAVRTRERVALGGGREGKVTSLAVFETGAAVQRPSASAGSVVKLRGLRDVRVGDRIGGGGAARATGHEFAPPTLESVVAPHDPDDAARLRDALGELAEQDPLIAVRQDGDGRLSISLYGEVQKEVVEATLAAEYGLEVSFRETTPIYVERPVAAGEAVERLHAPSNPCNATLGFRVEPAPSGSGVRLVADLPHDAIPLYVYKTAESFREHLDGYVRATLETGPYGWRVTDSIVTVTECAYSVWDGPPSRRGPSSTAADFRKLTPLVLRQALARAGTQVCEPTLDVRVELPADAIGGVLAALGRLGATAGVPSLATELATVAANLPAGRAGELERQLPALTRGEGVVESSFAGYRPVAGAPPRR